MKYLIVVDMQNDFIDAALGTAEAVAIVPAVKKKIEGFDGKIIFTQDTHFEEYMNTQEGKFLPVPHCIKDTDGWKIRQELLDAAACKDTEIVEKFTFGSDKLPSMVKDPESIEILGLCTDICVVSNALILKAFYPEVPISLDPACCAGVTPDKHNAAIEVMRSCQISING
ncbi:MAG: cysteine hydrolase [Lachnospiraceae bacterium]|nr:cysteine hydrolase [Lachnospiraceae bacterium]